MTTSATLYISSGKAQKLYIQRYLLVDNLYDETIVYPEVAAMDTLFIHEYNKEKR